MSKLEVWSFLHENPGFHDAKKLREMFGIKQQTTLKNWTTGYPFIGSYTANKGKLYTFLPAFTAEYEAAIGEELYVPPLKMKSGKEIPVEPDPIEDYCKITFPFPTSKLGDATEAQIEQIANLGDEWEWAKQAIREVNKIKMNSSSMPKQVVEALIVSLTGIMRYNGYNFKAMKLLEVIPEQTVEDIRKTEIDDIMKFVPKSPVGITTDDIPEDWK